MARGRALKSIKNPFCSFAARCVAGGNAFKTGCPMVRKCCCSVGGKPCTRGEVIREVSAKQLERWASNYNKPDLHTNQIVSYDAKRSGSKPFVCSYHALDILGELTSPAYFAAVAKPGRDPPPKPDRRDVVKCVLKAAHSHEKQLAKDAEQARVSMEAETPPPSLVIAAESKQPDDVVLEYEDLPDDDELPGDGERDLMAALDAVRAEED